MIMHQVFKEFKNGGLYSPEEFVEYIGYFNKEKSRAALRLMESLGDGCNLDLHKRIIGNTSSICDNVDKSISDKIVDIGYLSGKAFHDRYSLGIVSGCYDLLHLGHIKSFNYAKDYLIENSGNKIPALGVFILSDRTISEKKGKNRPILNINERLEMICALDCIDYVVVMNDKNCISALEISAPEYFFKDKADFSQEIVLEEIEAVNSHYGNTVVFPKDLKPKEVSSTTRIINELKN